MLVTNRMPPTPAVASAGSVGCFGGQERVWAMLQACLTVLAVFVILRSLARRYYKWWSGPAESLQDQGTRQQPSRTTAVHTVQELPTFINFMRDQKAIIPEGRCTDSDAPSASDGMWWHGAYSSPSPFVSRLPPAPPLTPPELSSAVFTVDDAPHRQDSFIHQPNPDYTTLTPLFSHTSPEPSSRPRRRSYCRTIPVGIPTSKQPQDGSVELTLAPSSYPPAGPLLPPPPHAPKSIRAVQGRVGVKGEIISVLDDEGAGWTRHTRVYGGTACLACAASGREHGGGFYGATVTRHEMR